MTLSTVLEQAQLLIDNENYEKAFGMLKAAHQSDAKNIEILEKLALLAETMEMPNEAIYYWEELVQNEPDNLVAHSQLQDLYFHLNKYKYYLTRAKVKTLNGNISQAVSDYKKAVDSTTDEKEIAEARFLLAKVYEFLGKTIQATDEYLRLIEHEDNIVFYYKLAELYAVEDKYEAIDILKRALKTFPDEDMAKEQLAGLYLATNQLDEALEFAQSDLTKAKIYLMKQENERAYELLSSFKSKNMPEYITLMAEYYFNKKEFKECLEKIEEFKKLNPENPLIYQMRALVAQEQDNNFEEHVNWGKYYLLKKDDELALSEFIHAHNLNSKDAIVIKEIIKIYERTADKHAILEFYEKLLKADPQNQEALKNIAKFYSDMYEFKEAINYYQQLLELNPKNIDIYKEVAFCWEKLKNYALAKEFYEKYLEKAPLNPETEKLKSKIAKMSNESSVEEDEGFLDKILKFFAK
jgi:tetratricopeptide (TPR) repeat protein